MEGEVNNNIVINWNNIVGQEARSMDNADLGKVQGLFEPFIVTERGTITRYAKRRRKRTRMNKMKPKL